MNLHEKYRELDRDLAMISYTMHDREVMSEQLFIPTREAIESLWAEHRRLSAQVAELEAPDRVFEMVKGIFQDFLDHLTYDIREQEESPLGSLLGFREKLQEYVRNDLREDNVRLMSIQNRVNLMVKAETVYFGLIEERYDEAGREKLSRSLRKAKMELMSEHPYIDGYFPGFTVAQLDLIHESLRKLEGEMGRLSEAFDAGNVPEDEILKDDWNKIVKMDPEKYRFLLANRMGVALDELLTWQPEEIEKTRAEVFDIASRLDIPEKAESMQDISDILFRYAGPCENPAEMYDRAKEYLKRTRAIAHEYVTLPEDETCVCVPLPNVYKEGYPWGGYEGGDFHYRPFLGHMFLNQHNYQNITDGWIKLNALHEAYPGHHVQYVRAAVDTTPETVKIGAKLIPLLEGTCLRTERTFTDTFPEDPFFPLFVAFRRHHCSVRIYVDLMLYYYGCTIGEAVEIYKKELGFDDITARRQVQAHENVPGYFTCYYYGMKKLSQWEQEYGFYKRDYTELLFSAGYVSLETFHRFICLTEEERASYARDFCSLLRQPMKERTSLTTMEK